MIASFFSDCSESSKGLGLSVLIQLNTKFTHQLLANTKKRSSNCNRNIYVAFRFPVRWSNHWTVHQAVLSPPPPPASPSRNETNAALQAASHPVF
jgi:hypothetical protein